MIDHHETASSAATVDGLLRHEGGTATVRFDRRYATDVADLWEAVTSPDRISRWFAPISGDTAVGGTFTIHFDDADAPSCRVVACDPPRGFAWEWDHGGVRTSHIEVSVRADGDGSVLHLVHTGLAQDGASDYAAGWQAHLNALGADVAGVRPADWWTDFRAVKAAYDADVAHRADERASGTGGASAS